MKNNNLTYETAEQQDDYIQSLSIDELKTSFVGKSVFTQNENVAITDESTKADEEMQNLQINELRNFVNLSKKKEQKYKKKHI